MPEENNNILNIMMKCKYLYPLFAFYKKYKEGILYLFFGGLTFFLSIIVFIVCNKILHIDALISNVLSWFSGVVFSFFTTRKWVFNVCNTSLYDIIHQGLIFLSSRIATLVLQEILLFLFINKLGFESVTIKVFTEIINIIINYLTSKFIIFKR